MNRDRVKELLYFYCPWWVSGKVPPPLLQGYKRLEFETLLSYSVLDRIMIIKGPRRTGKTTAVYQMIERLLSEGKIPPENILYLSFDDLELRLPLDEIFSIYEEILGNVIHNAGTVCCFMDEVHFLDGWQFMVKKYFDRKYPIKFIATCSSASFMRKSSESLAGRTVEHTLLPFSFPDYLFCIKKNKELRDIVLREGKDFSFEALPFQDAFLPFKKEIMIEFNRYLLWGGFPHLFEVADEFLKYKLLREDVLEKVIYRDLVELFGIKKPFVLEKLFLYLAGHSSEILNIENISNTLDISREYTEKYISYLKQAYIVETVRKYSPSVEKMLRCNEKSFMTDNGLVRIASGEVAPGKLAETAVLRHLRGREVYYWRDREEVDFVVNENGKIIPVEVKYKNVINSKDAAGLLKMARKYRLRDAVVVSRDVLEKREINGLNVHFIPAWLFTLLLGAQAAVKKAA